MPSLKYSCSASPLMLANGNTAIEGLSGTAGGCVAGRAASRPPMRKTRTGRTMFFTGFSPRSSSTIPSLSCTESRTARETKIAARVGESLQPRRDVDAVAVDVVAFDDHVSEIDADAELDAAVVQRGAVAVGHAGLDRDGAAHGLDRAGEIDQQAVAGAFDDASAVRGDVRVRRARRDAP